MKAFNVYHKMSGAAVWPVGYTAVAVVAAHDPDDAFEATNHIDHPWQDNGNVLVLEAGEGARSTSVGDVVLTENGEAYLCDSCGWLRIA